MGTRRGFLTSLLAATALPTLTWADAGSPEYLAAAREADGTFSLYGLRDDGSDAFAVALEARGHAGAGHPRRPEAVAFARRPGLFALVVDCVTGQTKARLTPPEGQYFNGHGTYSASGDVLYTVENRAETSEGWIGLWDSETWARMGQVPTLGIGPHDLLRLADGGLVVANGGLVTDPVSGDEGGHLEAMRSSLVYLSAEGAVLEQVALAPELQHLSIRHLAARADGLVGFAMQWQGDSVPEAPLVGLQRRGGVPVLMQAGAEEHLLMQGYAGSIAFDDSGEVLAISSPKGGRVQVFDVGAGYRRSVIRGDASGLATAPGGMLMTDGQGAVLRLQGAEVTVLARDGRAWDNHLVAL